MAIPIVETDFLIVGAGPAGASLACFLGQNGLNGITISSAPGTADTPRAHVVNPFAVECLRDIGLEDEAVRLATTSSDFQSMRWCRSMVGKEYGKVHCWGGHHDTARDTTIASPCRWMDLPQSHMEPILVKYAGHHHFPVRFNTKLVSAARCSSGHASGGGPILCTIMDLVTSTTYAIRTTFLLGADGGRSTVARAFPFHFLSEPSHGVACNILVNMDLSHLMHARASQLHWIMQPDRRTRFGIAPCLRLVRPWTQWLVIAVSPGTSENPFRDLTPTSPELIEFIKESVGDYSVEIEVLRLDPWVIRETVVERMDDGGDVFLLGDAAHRHPPAYGLGSNTCLQDAYNLAWKLAFVKKGLAGRDILDTYTLERQPVGAQLVAESNACMRQHMEVWSSLGMLAETAEAGQRQIQELEEASDAGTKRRAALHKALEGNRRKGESLGLTMNQWYASTAVYLDDEPAPRPRLEGDPLVSIQVSTYPGTRLPHAWLDIPTRRKEISTHDLAGHASFCLFTGHGGNAWKEAAEAVTRETGIPIKTYSIGFGLDYHDVYREWRERREVEEDGCVLVRPDRFIAWRSIKISPKCAAKLTKVLNRILSRDILEVK